MHKEKLILTYNKDKYCNMNIANRSQRRLEEWYKYKDKYINVYIKRYLDKICATHTVQHFKTKSITVNFINQLSLSLWLIQWFRCCLQAQCLPPFFSLFSDWSNAFSVVFKRNVFLLFMSIFIFCMCFKAPLVILMYSNLLFFFFFNS